MGIVNTQCQRTKQIQYKTIINNILTLLINIKNIYITYKYIFKIIK